MKATKKIVGAACALVAAVALSAGSTFAWFSSNSNVSVSQISANVVTMGGDLQIAVYKYTAPTGEGTTYTKGELGAYSYKAQNPFGNDLVLTGVTSIDANQFTLRGGTPDSPVEAVANTVATSGGYISFTVSLRSTTNMHVYLDSTSKVDSKAAEKETTIAAWKKITQTDYGKGAGTDGIAQGAAISAAAKNATRVAFVTSDSTPVKHVWAPYEETLNGGDDTTADGFHKGNLASDYELQSNNVADGDKASSMYNYTTPTAEEYTNKSVSVVKPAKVTTSDSESTTTYAEGNLICTLEANTPKEVTIYIWIEGRDGDCFNSIFTQQLLVDLAFHGEDIVEEEEPTVP